MKPATAIGIIVVIFLLGLGLVFWQLGLFNSQETTPTTELIIPTPITSTSVDLMPITATAIPPTGIEPFYPTATETETTTTSYTVKSGDTLWIIANHFYNDGSKWKLIHDANRDKISNPNKLKVGTNLVIPNAGVTVPKRSSSIQNEPGLNERTEQKTGTYHTVSKGDSLWKLARKYYNDSTKTNLIFEVNRDKMATPGTTLQTGWKLFIPTASKKEGIKRESPSTTPSPSDNVPVGVGD